MLTQSARTLQRRLQVKFERATVWQLSQRIVMRKVRDLGLSFDPVAFRNPLQLQFGLLAGADIFYNTHEQFDGLITVSDAPDRQMRPDDTAVLSEIALFQIVVVDIAIQDPPHLREIGGEILRIGEVLKRQPFQLIGGVAQKLTQTIIDL